MKNKIVERTALVIETNNLRGGDHAGIMISSLQRVIRMLNSQTIPITELAQIVITHDGISNECCAELVKLAGRDIDFVQIDSSTGYYDAKNLGFSATDVQRCDYIVFADSDCMPAPIWLEELLKPLESSCAPAVVAGRTSYSSDLAGTALTTIDFMYFPSPLQSDATRNFYANNVVFRRDVFTQYSYKALNGVYRAHCQVLGLRLQEARVPLHYAPKAHTVHRFPDTRFETLKLRWLRGQDTYGLTPHLVRAYLPRYMQWLGNSGPVGPLCVLVSRLWFSVRALNHQDMPPVRGLRRLGALALIVGFSTVDILGALFRGMGIRSSANADAQALSYHRS